MVRARTREHLESLQKHFPQLTAAEITDTTNTDYRFRMVVAKTVWAEVAQELAAEIDYGNFKDRAERRSHDDRYVDALHDVWGVMKRLQPPSR